MITEIFTGCYVNLITEIMVTGEKVRALNEQIGFCILLLGFEGSNPVVGMDVRGLSHPVLKSMPRCS